MKRFLVALFFVVLVGCGEATTEEEQHQGPVAWPTEVLLEKYR